MKTLLRKTERLADRASLFVANISALFLLLLVVLTVVDVIGRYFFTAPVVGAVELVETAMALIIFLAFPMMFMRSEVIIVDLLPVFRRGILGWGLSILFLAVTAWAAYIIGEQTYKYAIRAIEDGDKTEYLHLPRWPVVLLISVVLYTAAIISVFRLVILLTRPGISSEDLAEASQEVAKQ